MSKNKQLKIEGEAAPSPEEDLLRGIEEEAPVAGQLEDTSGQPEDEEPQAGPQGPSIVWAALVGMDENGNIRIDDAEPYFHLPQKMDPVAFQNVVMELSEQVRTERSARRVKAQVLAELLPLIQGINAQNKAATG